MKTRIRKWGNSMAVRIPKTIAKEANLDIDSPVELSLNDGVLEIAPVRETYKLDDLVQRICKKNRHDEEDFGAAHGMEVW